jgi:hypothetical protein
MFSCGGPNINSNIQVSTNHASSSAVQPNRVMSTECLPYIDQPFWPKCLVAGVSGQSPLRGLLSEGKRLGYRSRRLCCCSRFAVACASLCSRRSGAFLCLRIPRAGSSLPSHAAIVQRHVSFRVYGLRTLRGLSWFASRASPLGWLVGPRLQLGGSFRQCVGSLEGDDRWWCRFLQVVLKYIHVIFIAAVPICERLGSCVP